MNATMTEYYTVDEILGDLRDGLGVSTMDAVLDGLESMTRCRDFGDYTQVPVLNDDKFGLIGIKEFFEDADVCFEKFDSVEELEEFLSHHDWLLKIEDNTYNHGGSMEREFNYNVFESSDDDEVVAFFSVHTGLDIRAGYTEYFAIQFDSMEEFFLLMCQSHFLAEANFTVDGEKMELRCYGEAANEYVDVYAPISDSGLDLNIDTQTVDISTYNKDDFRESVLAFLKDNNITIDNGSLTVE